MSSGLWLPSFPSPPPRVRHPAGRGQASAGSGAGASLTGSGSGAGRGRGRSVLREVCFRRHVSFPILVADLGPQQPLARLLRRSQHTLRTLLPRCHSWPVPLAATAPAQPAPPGASRPDNALARLGAPQARASWRLSCFLQIPLPAGRYAASRNKK